MEKRILSAIDGGFAILPMSPCGLHIIDGNGVVLAHLIYEVDKDVGCPVEYDQAALEVYGSWGTPTAPMPVPLPPVGPYCPSELQTVVVKIPIKWVETRSSLPLGGGHWLGEVRGVPHDAFSMDILLPKMVPTGQITGGGEEFMKEWNCQHPLFYQLGLLKSGNFDQDPLWREQRNLTAPKLEELPLEVYEVLVKYLDGLSVKNLCKASLSIEGTVFEALASPKRQLRWYTFCTKDLERATVTKVLRSYDIRMRMNPSSPQENHLSWKTVFEAYQRFWSTLSNGTLKVTDLEQLERKLKGELLFYKQTPPRPMEKYHHRVISSGYWTTRCAGGGVLYNIHFPCPSTPLNEANLVVMDMEEAYCKGFAPICRNSFSSCFSAKLAHFPVLRNGQVGKNLPEVDRVLIGVCDKCITASPILGGTTSRCTLQLTKMNFPSCKMDPIVEISDNLIAVWIDPLNLMFFILRPSTTHTGYSVKELYRLNFPNMRSIWDRIAEHRLDYVPVLRVYKGQTLLLEGHGEGGSGYPFNSTEDTFYGLTFVSHIYGVESFKPSSDSDVAIVSSLEPRYYSNNGRQHLPLLRKAQCSGKGHGLFVFCNNEAIAVSSDGITWIFDKLAFLRTNKVRHAYHVEVIYDDGMLLVADENIIFMKLSLKVDPPNMINGINLTEPVLEVKPVRIIKLDFFPWYRKITQVELDFENGLPFLFIVAERIFRKVRNDRTAGEVTDGLDFIMKRIDFLANEPDESNN